MRLKPSNAFLWTKCLYSVHYLDIPVSKFKTTTGAKKMGIVAHLVANNLLKGNEPFKNIKGKQLLRNIDKEEVLKNAKWYVKQIKKLVSNDMTKLAETSVKLTDFIPQKNASGKIDFVAYNEEKLIIVDYKSGMQDVKAKNNPQLILYAAGMLLNHYDFQGNRVLMYIVQPAKKKVYKDELSIEKVMKKAAKIKKQAIKAIKELDICKEGVHCTHCEGFGDCPATKWAKNYFKSEVK